MRRSMLALVFLAFAGGAFGLQVDKAELSKGQNADIQFVNYVGPHSKIDTIAQIVSIGGQLGQRVVASLPGDFSYYGLYRVIHAVTPAEPDKLDADILVIEKGATVDDVVNVIRIVSGYLEAAYSYSPADAAVLAKFIVYYNAAYRGDMKYITSTYKSAVTQHVTAENVGIARVYSQWPGNTRMLIPLSQAAAKGSVSAVGAEQLTSPKVIQNLQAEPNKGIPDRKAITELQQKGIVQDQQKVDTQKAQIASQEQKIQAEQQKIQAQQSQVDQQKQTAATPAQKQAAAASDAALQQQKAQVTQQQQQVDQQKQAVAAQEKQLAQRQQDVQKQRQSIASDQRTILEQQPPATITKPSQTTTASVAQPGEVLFVYDQEGTGEHLGKLVVIDRVSGKLKASSDLNTIRNRRYEKLATAYVVVAGRAGGSGAIKLVSLDQSSLAVVSQSTLSIAPSSALAVSESDVYAISVDGGVDHLARFDSSLKELAVSGAAVDPFSDIVVSGSEVYVQDAQGNILILDKSDLQEKKRSGG